MQFLLRNPHMDLLRLPPYELQHWGSSLKGTSGMQEGTEMSGIKARAGRQLFLRQNESEFVIGFFKRNRLWLQKFLPLSQSLLLLKAEVMGTCLPGSGTLGWEAWCGAGTPHSQDIPPNFLSTTLVCGTSPFHILASPTSLDECGFFNSLVVRLPFNLISDCSEWWLFYNLVVIFMWLCEEMSCVYLCCHLDWKSLCSFI